MWCTNTGMTKACYGGRVKTWGPGGGEGEVQRESSRDTSVRDTQQPLVRAVQVVNSMVVCAVFG